MKYLLNTATLELNAEKCTGCAMCKNVCPHGVFVIEDRKAKIVRKNNCMECGACSLNCPENALTVRSGVGCAAGVIYGKLKGTEASCGCS